MTTINSFRDLTVGQVSTDLADACFDIVEATSPSRKLVPTPLHAKVVILIEPIGKMLHGLAESLELRLNADNA